MNFFSRKKDENKPEMTTGQIMQVVMRIASAAVTGSENMQAVIKEVVQNFVTDEKLRDFIAMYQKGFVGLERRYNAKIRVVIESNIDFTDLVIRIWLQEPNTGYPKLWIEKYGSQLTQADLLLLIELIYKNHDGNTTTITHHD